MFDTRKQGREQPAGNYYDKYGTSNPIARFLMRRFLHSFDGLVERCGSISSALEVGCGEGELSIRLARRGIPIHGLDIADSVIKEARLRALNQGVNASFEARSVTELDSTRDRADLVVCCEVLEHLEDPEEALGGLIKCTQSYLLVSVPREPIWRAMNVARGKYLTSFGNTPGHVQHWSQRSFLALLRRHARIVEVRTPLPWTMALCRPANQS